MTVNIAAVQALFPDRSEVRVRGPAVAAIRGPCSFDAIRALQADAFPPSFVEAVEKVRCHERWGAVYRGDLTSFSDDHSAADLALCSEFARRGLDQQEIDAAMRTSGLYREKWERDDYRQNTIALAATRAPHVQSGPGQGLLRLADGQIDFSTASPPPREWVIDGMMLAGKSALLAGLSGVSKTTAALLASMAIATGTRFAGRATRGGKVIFISGEEDRDELRRRVNAYIRMNNMDPVSVQAIRDGLLSFPLVGKDIRLCTRAGGTLESTALHQQIIDLAREAGDVRLIVLDHVGLLHGGDFNAKEDAAMTMRLINGIAQETGAALILLAHSPKSSARDEESDASAIYGSTAFVEQARGGWLMATMRPPEAKKLGISEGLRKEYVSLVGVKANYSAAGQTFWFHKKAFDEVGVLEHVELVPPAPGGKPAADLESNVIAAVRFAPGQYSKTGMRDAFSGKKGLWKASKGDVAGAIERLVTEGRLINRQPTVEEKAKFGHGSQVRSVLDLGGH